MLSVRDISKAYGAIRAVDGVSFDVRPGEILGLIGPNGSGKSTLFNCILGQLAPDRGKVEVKGRSVSDRRARELNRLGVGRTFQHLSVFPQMSVIDNIILAGQEHRGSLLSRLLGAPDAGLTAEADPLIEFFRLAHLRHETAGSLSYGQQKLVDAAMAFMAGPSLVLLDEPAGGVNLTMLAALKERLASYNREHGTTFVVIEQNMEFVMSLCCRIIVLAEGRIIAEGPPEEVRANPTVYDRMLSKLFWARASPNEIAKPELALKHRLRKLQRDRRRRMRGLAKPHRPSRNHHLDRNARLGARRSPAKTLGTRSLRLDRAANWPRVSASGWRPECGSRHDRYIPIYSNRG